MVNRNGSKKTELFIDPEMFDALCDSGVTDVLATAEAVGAWDERVRDQEFFYGGDVSMAALNDIRAWSTLEEDKLEWLDGADSSIFATSQAYCVLSEESARRFDTELGGEVSLAVYAVRRNSSGVTYALVEDAAFKVAGIYHNGSTVDKDMYISTAWMRAAAERNGIFFSYDSAVCRVDARNINGFKEKLPKIGFMPTFDGADNLYRGDAVVVDDEMFVKTGGRLRSNLSIYRSFLLPFYVLVAILVTLVTFLMLRGSRRDMAIASSLGQSKGRTFLAHFADTMLAYLAGCVTMVPAAVWLAGLSIWESMAVCGIFSVCAGIGVVMALVMLLRFDTLALLTKTD